MAGLLRPRFFLNKLRNAVKPVLRNRKSLKRGRSALHFSGKGGRGVEGGTGCVDCCYLPAGGRVKSTQRVLAWFMQALKFSTSHCLSSFSFAPFSSSMHSTKIDKKRLPAGCIDKKYIIFYKFCSVC